MQVTIIPDDGIVYVEGHPTKVDLTGLDANIHAVQWNGVTNAGWIEFKSDPETSNRPLNEMITDLSSFQHFVDLWEIEAQRP